jgi:hypothetical protein
MFVILSPSLCVTLTLSEAKGKGLAFWLRVNSVKDLMSSFALLRTCFPACRQAGANASE